MDVVETTDITIIVPVVIVEKCILTFVIWNLFHLFSRIGQWKLGKKIEYLLVMIHSEVLEVFCKIFLFNESFLLDRRYNSFYLIRFVFVIFILHSFYFSYFFIELKICNYSLLSRINVQQQNVPLRFN